MIRHARQRGQVTVEFVFVSLMLMFLMMMSFQFAWAACQKWYFNFTAAYAARAWSVHAKSEGQSPLNIVQKTQITQYINHDGLADVPLVRAIDAEDHDASWGEFDADDRFGIGSVLPQGIRYRGLAYMIGFFKPATIQSAGFESRGNGSILFETYIPIEHEENYNGEEDPIHYDNDCSVPCGDNGRY